MNIELKNKVETSGANFALFLLASMYCQKTRSFIKIRLSVINDFLEYTDKKAFFQILEAVDIPEHTSESVLSNTVQKFLGNDLQSINFVLDSYRELMAVDEEDIKGYKQVIMDRLIDQCVGYYTTLFSQARINQDTYFSKIKILEEFRNINKFEDSQLSQELDIGNLDVSQLVNKMTSVIYTPYPEINNSYPEGGLLTGQLGIISGPSGRGKTLFSLNLASGFVDDILNPSLLNVYVLLIGDMDLYNVTTRLTCINGRVPYHFVRNPEEFAKYYEEAKRIAPNVFNSRRLFFHKIAPGKFTCEEWINHIYTTEFKDTGKKIVDYFDVFMIDYEGNFGSNSVLKAKDSGINIHLEGGEVFNMLKQLAEYKSEDGRGKSVMALAQPSKGKADQKLTQDDISGSARKQNIVDYIFTISVKEEWMHPTYCGILHCPKSRNTNPFTYGFVKDIDGTFILRNRKFIENIGNMNGQEGCKTKTLNRYVLDPSYNYRDYYESLDAYALAVSNPEGYKQEKAFSIANSEFNNIVQQKNEVFGDYQKEEEVVTDIDEIAEQLGL